VDEYVAAAAHGRDRTHWKGDRPVHEVGSADGGGRCERRRLHLPSRSNRARTEKRGYDVQVDAAGHDGFVVVFAVVRLEMRMASVDEELLPKTPYVLTAGRGSTNSLLASQARLIVDAALPALNLAPFSNVRGGTSLCCSFRFSGDSFGCR
jgi:hypothetical protein